VPGLWHSAKKFVKKKPSSPGAAAQALGEACFLIFKKKDVYYGILLIVVTVHALQVTTMGIIALKCYNTKMNTIYNTKSFLGTAIIFGSKIT